VFADPSPTPSLACLPPSLIILSACAVWVRVKSGEGFKLFRNVEGLWSPNAPLLASLCLGICEFASEFALVPLSSAGDGGQRGERRLRRLPSRFAPLPNITR